MEDAEALADRLLVEAQRRSIHTRQHAYPLKAFEHLTRGAWEDVTAVAHELTRLVDANPDASFCLIGAAGCAYGAIAETITDRPPNGLDEIVGRMVESTLVQATTVMVPKVMAGDERALSDGTEGLRPGSRGVGSSAHLGLLRSHAGDRADDAGTMGP